MYLFQLKAHICKQLGIPETGRVYIWDYPHLLQLVWMAAVIGDKEISKVIEDVANITSFFRYSNFIEVRRFFPDNETSLPSLLSH